MKLYLLRHGVAADLAPDGRPDDARRELTPAGIDKLRAAAPAYSRLIGRPDRIVASDLVRAVQTAEILVEACGGGAFEQRDFLRPGAPVERALDDVLGRADERIVLVGHEPHLGALTGRLLTGTHAAIPLKKGMLVGIEVDEPYAHIGRLLFSLSTRAARDLRD